MENMMPHGGFQVAISTMKEAMDFCRMMAQTELCPSTYKPETFLRKMCNGKQELMNLPENQEKAMERAVANIYIACSYGASLGMTPFQALQGIGIVNGKPTVYGDMLLGLVRPLCQDFSEFFDYDHQTAVCQILRKGTKHPVQATFSWADAQRAGLAGKQGPWSQYPQRMMQMRARGFAIRDAFPDVLSGIITREEAEDYVLTDTQQIDNSQQVIQQQPQKAVAKTATTEKEKAGKKKSAPAALPQQTGNSAAIPQQQVQAPVQQPAPVDAQYQEF